MVDLAQARRHIKSNRTDRFEIISGPETMDINEADEGGCGQETRRGRPAAGNDPAKRRQIMDGARRVFMEMGFDAASMNDITRAAGVSKGTIYVYFANKEELFEALVDEERHVIFGDLYRALGDTSDLRAALVRFGLALSVKITAPQVIRAQRTVIGASERIPELGRRFYERGPKQGHDRVMAFLAAAVERGWLEIDDLDLAAYQLTELMLAGLFRQCLFAYRTEAPGSADIEYVVRAGVDVFLRAYGTEALAREEQKAAATS